MWLSWLILSVLGACKDEVEKTVDVVSEIDAWEPEAIEAISVVGYTQDYGRVEVPFRLVNSYRAAVPGSTMAVSVDAETAAPVTSSIDVDAYGYGIVEIEAPRPEAFTVTVTSSGDGVPTGASAVSYAVGGPLPRYRMAGFVALDELEDTPSLAALGTGGVAVAAGEEIWWVPAQPGVPAHSVARLTGRVKGMWSAHVDSDGVLDLVAWDGPEVVLLRGHPLGGFAFGGAWESLTDDVVGVAVADFDSDLNADIAIGVSSETESQAVVLKGDGAWGFEPLEPLLLNSQTWSIAAADEDRDGRPDLNVLNANRQSLRRYTLGEEGWAGGSPPELAGYTVPDDSYLLPLVDVNGDGTLEVVIVGGAGSTQDLVFYLVQDQIRYPDSFNPFFPATADMNNDGATDLLALDDRQLNLIRWEEATTGFKKQEITSLGVQGPLAGDDFDGDDNPDLAVAIDDAVVYFPGLVDNDGSWGRDSFDWKGYSAAITGDVALRDFNGDGVADVIGFASSSGQTTVSSWLVEEGTSGDLGLTLADRVNLGEGTEGLGLRLCGGYAFALYGSGGANTLARFSVDATGAPSMDLSTNVSGTLLACAEDLTGGITVAVAATSGSYSTYDENLDDQGSGSVGSSQAIAVALTGSTTTEVVSCLAAGCSIAALDLDGDGQDEVVRGGTSISIEIDGVETDLGYAGTVGTGDVDLDGNPDVLALDAEDGNTWVFRGLSNGLAPPVSWLTEQDASGAVHLGDLTGDGIPELVLISPEGQVILGGQTGQPAPAND